MKYIENIVIGKSIDNEIQMFALSEEDWEQNEKETLVMDFGWRII